MGKVSNGLYVSSHPYTPDAVGDLPAVKDGTHLLGLRGRHEHCGAADADGTDLAKQAGPAAGSRKGVGERLLSADRETFHIIGEQEERPHTENLRERFAVLQADPFMKKRLPEQGIFQQTGKGGGGQVYRKAAPLECLRCLHWKPVIRLLQHQADIHIPWSPLAFHCGTEQDDIIYALLLEEAPADARPYRFP